MLCTLQRKFKCYQLRYSTFSIIVFFFSFFLSLFSIHDQVILWYIGERKKTNNNLFVSSKFLLFVSFLVRVSSSFLRNLEQTVPHSPKSGPNIRAKNIISHALPPPVSLISSNPTSKFIERDVERVLVRPYTHDHE